MTPQGWCRSSRVVIAHEPHVAGNQPDELPSDFLIAKVEGFQLRQQAFDPLPDVGQCVGGVLWQCQHLMRQREHEVLVHACLQPLKFKLAKG